MTENIPVSAPAPGSDWSIEGLTSKASGVQLNSYKLRVMLMGKTGTGKSQSAVTLPGRILLIDFDGRKETVAGAPNIDTISILEKEPGVPKAWGTAEAVRKKMIVEINKGVFPYDSVVWDGATSLGEYCMNWALTLDPKHNLGGAPAQQHYTPQMHNFMRFVESTLSMPVHVLWTGHPVLIDDPEGRSVYTPNVYGKGPRATITSKFNECYFCFRKFDPEHARQRFYWYTAGEGKFDFFKSALNNLGRYWTDPVELDFDSSDPVGFQDLLARRFGRQEMEQYYASLAK